MIFRCSYSFVSASSRGAVLALLLAVLAASAVPCAAQTVGEAETAAPQPNEGTNSTVITSDRLSYDAEKRLAVFEGNVVVRDPDMHMTADTLTIIFSEDNNIESIRAQGAVTMKHDEISGRGDEAVYYLQEGKVVLTGKPKVTRKHDELSGETITYFRATGRMICEPNAVLKLHSIPDLQDGALRKDRGP